MYGLRDLVTRGWEIHDDLLWVIRRNEVRHFDSRRKPLLLFRDFFILTCTKKGDIMVLSESVALASFDLIV
jgi:hypothetical protein